MMHKSQLKKNDPYDRFCGPGSHMLIRQAIKYIDTSIVALYYYTSNRLMSYIPIHQEPG